MAIDTVVEEAKKAVMEPYEVRQGVKKAKGAVAEKLRKPGAELRYGATPSSTFENLPPRWGDQL